MKALNKDAQNLRTIYSENDVDRIENEILSGGEGSGSGSGSAGESGSTYGSSHGNLFIPVLDEECGLYALTQTRIYKTNVQEGDGFNASDYYQTLKNFATDIRDEEGNQLYSGGAMTRDVLLMTGAAFNLFEYNQEFNSDTRKEFFSDSEGENGETIPGKYSSLRIIHILKRDKVTNQYKDHYAAVKKNGIDTRNHKIYYTDYDNGGVVSFDEVLGAFY